MRKGIIIGVLLLTGCRSAAYKVATAQNSYDFRLARYNETCGAVPPPTPCAATYQKLLAFDKHLHEAASALKAGGGLPLQLAAIKADDKALKP
jgi:hypothetical protein